MSKKPKRMGGIAFVGILAICAGVAAHAQSQSDPGRAVPIPAPSGNAMVNPYKIIPNWPHLGEIKPGSAIGLVPDGKGGVWMGHRSTPAIVHIDASGNIIQSINAPISTAHGLCRDRDGNFWALDSGTFNQSADTGVRGNQVFKFSPEGKLLLTLGKAGVGKAGTDTFLQPAFCTETPDGNMVFADGHWPRPGTAQQDGDRLVFFTRDGKFIKSFGRHGRLPGEFQGPHALAYDSQGRLFVADRNNNRIQIFDKDMKFVDEWKHFGRPSNLVIMKDDTLYVADSESNRVIEGPVDAPEGVRGVRNPGWKTGIRIGSAKDGSLKYFINGTEPEGLAVDDAGNIFAGLTAGCNTSLSGGCLQKWIKK